MQKRDKKWQQRFTIFLGIFLSFGMVAGLVLPLIQNSITQNQQTARPTEAPPPTAPAPPDTSTIAFTDTYLHPSGLFTAALPTGYVLTNEFNSTGEAQVTMENPDALSILEIRVIRPTDQISLDSPQGLSEQFSEEWLRSSWSRYSSWEEDARNIEDEQLVMDFNLTRNRQNYVARQVAFTDSDGTWIYTIRVISPSNAASAMQYVLENEVASFETIDRFIGEPLEWSGYFDNVNNHLLRFPGTWSVVDTAPGAPTSIAGDAAQLLIQTNPAPLTTADAARSYVSDLRSNITVLSVVETEQFGVSGFRVAYTIPTVDEPSQSGIVQILNDAEMAHITNVLLTDVQDTDLNNVDTSGEGVADNIVQTLDLLDTFSLFPDLEIVDS